jgi:hypothetical protein
MAGFHPADERRQAKLLSPCPAALRGSIQDFAQPVFIQRMKEGKQSSIAHAEQRWEAQ